jgi:hypothetical protein
LAGIKHQAVLFTCLSLITIVDDGNSDVSRYHIPLQPAHIILAQAYLAVLLRSYDCFDGSSVDDFPLAEYAAKRWDDHVRFEVSSSIRDTIEYVFDEQITLEKHFIGFAKITNFRSVSQMDVRSHCSMIHSAVCMTEEHLIVKHPPQRLNPVGDPDAIQLVGASMERQFHFAQLFSQHGADVNTRDDDINIALLHVASMVSDQLLALDVVRWLRMRGMRMA